MPQPERAAALPVAGGLAFHRPAPSAQEQAATPAPIPLGVPVHPAANLFPMMSRGDLELLAADIKKEGQREACVVHEGQLLDGRNRWAACQLAGVTPRIRPWEGGDSPTAYVLSLNLHRRHLRPEQRAALAVDLKPLYAAEAEARMRAGAQAHPGGDSPPGSRNEGGRSIVAAARAAGAGETSAKKLEAAAGREPKVLPLARQGKAPVDALAAAAKLPPKQRAERIAALERGEKPARAPEAAPAPRPRWKMDSTKDPIQVEDRILQILRWLRVTKGPEVVMARLELAQSVGFYNSDDKPFSQALGRLQRREAVETANPGPSQNDRGWRLTKAQALVDEEAAARSARATGSSTPTRAGAIPRTAAAEVAQAKERVQEALRVINTAPEVMHKTIGIKGALRALTYLTKLEGALGDWGQSLK